MKIESTNQWLTLFGNIGVLAGIVFVGIEIQQNTSMTQSQTRDAMTEKQMAFYELVLSDPLITQAWANSLAMPFSIPPNDRSPSVEELRNEMVLRSEFRMWENEWYQYQQGLFSAEEFEPRINLWKSFMGRDSYKWYWENRFKESHSPSFAAQINAMVTGS